MPKTKLTLKNLPKAFGILPKWQHFDKSGHTECNSGRKVSRILNATALS